jgi:hypothetical protein
MSERKSGHRVIAFGEYAEMSALQQGAAALLQESQTARQSALLIALRTSAIPGFALAR